MSLKPPPVTPFDSRAADGNNAWRHKYPWSFERRMRGYIRRECSFEIFARFRARWQNTKNHPRAICGILLRFQRRLPCVLSLRIVSSRYRTKWRCKSEFRLRYVSSTLLLCRQGKEVGEVRVGRWGKLERRELGRGNERYCVAFEGRGPTITWLIFRWSSQTRWEFFLGQSGSQKNITTVSFCGDQEAVRTPSNWVFHIALNYLIG